MERKSKLHTRNKNNLRYDLSAMSRTTPELTEFIKPNKRGEDSINFSNPKAVKALNRSILKHYYNIQYWEFPDENLCPAIPGRAEYVHALADLLSENNNGKVPRGSNIRCMDIGVGAACIYPIIGVTEYDWNFVASDIDVKSIASAQEIVKLNPSLKGKIECIAQSKPDSIFKGIVKEDDRFDLSMSNPPFHSSIEEATKGSKRKIKNLAGIKSYNGELNFSGIQTELVYKGGEMGFISNMITESKSIGKRCLWFSTLVSKESNLKKIDNLLENSNVMEKRTLDIATGNKVSRIIAWTFLNADEKVMWQKSRW